MNFPANNLNFHWRWRWWDQIQAIFSNLFNFTFQPPCSAFCFLDQNDNIWECHPFKSTSSHFFFRTICIENTSRIQCFAQVSCTVELRTLVGFYRKIWYTVVFFVEINLSLLYIIYFENWKMYKLSTFLCFDTNWRHDRKNLQGFKKLKYFFHLRPLVIWSHWHELSKQEKSSFLVPLRGIFMRLNELGRVSN